MTRPGDAAAKMADRTPEPRYPAELEDIDTIIAGSDGKDYVVDIVDGQKRWVPYLPEADHVVTIEKILPKIELVAAPAAEAPKKAQQNRYQVFMQDMNARLKKEQPKLSGKERMELIQQTWRSLGSPSGRP